jgi:hypothetical protein
LWACNRSPRLRKKVTGEVLNALESMTTGISTLVVEVVEQLCAAHAGELRRGHDVDRLYAYASSVGSIMLASLRDEQTWPARPITVISKSRGLGSAVTAHACQLLAERFWEQLLEELDSVDSSELVSMVARLVSCCHEIEYMTTCPDRPQHEGGTTWFARASAADMPTPRIADRRSQAEVRLARSTVGQAVVVLPTRDISTVANTPLPKNRRRARKMAFDLGAEVALFISAQTNPSRFDQDLVTAATEEFRALSSPAAAGLAVCLGRDHTTAAIKEAQEVSSIVTSLNYSPGLYRSEDVAMEILLSRSLDVADMLANRVRPLQNGQLLVETLRAYLDNTQSRKQLANRLHIHQNTLTYRLRRVYELTGLSPNAPKDAKMLWAACLSLQVLGE